MIDPLDDALLALRLFAIDPRGLGGMWLRGGAGPVRDRLIELLGTWLPTGAMRRLPVSIDDDRLIGGIDLGASLAAGRAVTHSGLLDEARNGVLVLHGAERARETLTGRLALAMDQAGPALVMVDDGEGDERAPAALTDRVAFHVDLGAIGRVPALESFDVGLENVAAPSAEVLNAIGGIACALGVQSTRTMIFALRAARASACLHGRSEIGEEDVTVAARLVLAPSATRFPAAEDDEAPPPPEDDDGGQDESDRSTESLPLEDLVLEAVRASLPVELLERLTAGKARGRGPAPRGAGARKRSRLRGRAIGARPGVPAGGLRLALIATLRAAAPWQKLRGGGAGRLSLRKDDLRVRRFEDRETALTIFAVDASGSAAFARLAEAKGAVELLLQRAYAKRSEVALIAFRGTGAELLLPPTRSLTRARRLLAELPGGGGTPLAAGLDAARELAESSRARGRTPQIVVLTDGRANITADGGQGRVQADLDGKAAARRIAATGLTSVVIDIGPRRQPEADALAGVMAARYFHLPRADASAVMAAVAA